jgi:hypothetical protein
VLPPHFSGPGDLESFRDGLPRFAARNRLWHKARKIAQPARLTTGFALIAQPQQRARNSQNPIAKAQTNAKIQTSKTPGQAVLLRLVFRRFLPGFGRLGFGNPARPVGCARPVRRASRNL